jgi:hypothetical protein
VAAQGKCLMRNALFSKSVHTMIHTHTIGTVKEKYPRIITPKPIRHINQQIYAGFGLTPSLQRTGSLRKLSF